MNSNNPFLSSRKFATFLACLSAIAAFSTLHAQPFLPTSVLYSDDWEDARYATLRGLLDEVFGDDDPSSGEFTETEAQYFTVAGEGPQEVDFAFLYDGGGYTFEFGFFYITDELLALPTDSVAEKQAWAVEALTEAQVVIVDAYADTVPSGAFRVTPDDTNPYSSEPWEYSGVRSSVNSTTLTLEGGSRIGFFIIPDNTLANFLADWNDNGQFNNFDINGSNAENDGRNWPLFSIDNANPGLQAGNTGAAGNPLLGDIGTNPDQVLTFDGTTQEGWLGPGSQAITGTMVSFEDLWRRPEPGGDWWNSSDEDFEDLVFYIGNVTSVNPVPEPTTVLGAIAMGLLIGAHALRRKRKNNAPAAPLS